MSFRCGCGNCEGVSAVVGPGGTGALACQSCLPGGGCGSSDVCGQQRIAVEFRARNRRKKRNLRAPLRVVKFACGRNPRPSSHTRWVLAWKMVDGEKAVKACPVATGYQDPGLRGGKVDAPGRDSFRSSRLQVISLGAVGKWEIWSLDIKNAFLQADGFCREAFLCAPANRDPKGAHRMRQMQAPAYGVDDAPAALRKTLKRYLLRPENLLACVGFKFQVSSVDPCP